MSVSLRLEDVKYLDILSFENKDTDTSIYHPLSECTILTVGIGAKYSDGFVLIADRKFTILTQNLPNGIRILNLKRQS